MNWGALIVENLTFLQTYCFSCLQGLVASRGQQDQPQGLECAGEHGYHGHHHRIFHREAIKLGLIIWCVFTGPARRWRWQGKDNCRGESIRTVALWRTLIPVHAVLNPLCVQVKQEQLGMGSEKGEYYSTTATVSFFQKVSKLWSFIISGLSELVTHPTFKFLNHSIWLGTDVLRKPAKNCSQDKALYKACGRESDGRQCNKKVLAAKFLSQPNLLIIRWQSVVATSTDARSAATRSLDLPGGWCCRWSALLRLESLH